MGRIDGNTSSFTRFRVLDNLTDEQWSAVTDKLRQYAFQGIDELPEIQAHGWVCFEDMLDSAWRTSPGWSEAAQSIGKWIDTPKSFIG